MAVLGTERGLTPEDLGDRERKLRQKRKRLGPKLLVRAAGAQGLVAELERGQAEELDQGVVAAGQGPEATLDPVRQEADQETVETLEEVGRAPQKLLSISHLIGKRVVGEAQGQLQDLMMKLKQGLGIIMSTKPQMTD